MKKFEYKDYYQYDSVVGLTKKLNELGAEGWELVNFSFGPPRADGVMGAIYCILKRELKNSGAGGLY